MNWHSSSNSTIANEKEDVMSKDACSFNLIMSLCLSIIKCIKFITLCIHRMARASLGRHFAFRSRFCLLLSGMCAMCVCRQSWSQPHAGYTRSIVYSICSSHRSVSMSPQILYGTRERLVLQTQAWGHRRYSSKGSVSGDSRATRKAPYLSYIVPSHNTHTHTQYDITVHLRLIEWWRALCVWDNRKYCVYSFIIASISTFHNSRSTCSTFSMLLAQNTWAMPTYSSRYGVKRIHKGDFRYHYFNENPF